MIGEIVMFDAIATIIIALLAFVGIMFVLRVLLFIGIIVFSNHTNR